jgi:hypothetical protein
MIRNEDGQEKQDCELMLLMEEEYQKTWGSFGRRETFFEGLRFSFRRFLHESWEAFLMFVLGDELWGSGQ